MRPSFDAPRLLRETRAFAEYLTIAGLHRDWTLEGVRQITRLLVDGRKDMHAVLFAHAANLPDKPAVVENGRVTTYSELNRLACRFGNGLYERGIRRRDKVVVAFGNSTEALVAAAGAAHLGAVCVPCSTS